MKQKSGKDYKQSAVKVTWNSTAKQLQEMYFRDFNIKFDPFADIECLYARFARDKRDELYKLIPVNKKRVHSL